MSEHNRCGDDVKKIAALSHNASEDLRGAERESAAANLKVTKARGDMNGHAQALVNAVHSQEGTLTRDLIVRTNPKTAVLIPVDLNWQEVRSIPILEAHL